MIQKNLYVKNLKKTDVYDLGLGKDFFKMVQKTQK